MKVRFAVSLDAGRVEPDHLASLVTGAEERGFDTLWFADLPLVNTADPTLAVAFAAGLSRRLKLGVDLVPFGHQSFVVARQLAQLDQLTDGRLLVTVVPGLDLPGERAALGIAGRDRGRLLDSLLPELRTWWAGSAVTVGRGSNRRGDAPGAPPTGPARDLARRARAASRPPGRPARRRVAWLGRCARPREAGELCRRIKEEAAAAGREIDPEHFGLSIRYARVPDDLSAPGSRPIGSAADQGSAPAPPVGAGALRDLVGELVQEGMSKFVVRRATPVASWPDELDWLADAVLDLQT